MAKDTRIPNTFSPIEVRRAFAGLRKKSDLLDDGAAGEVLVGVAVGTNAIWGTELTALTKVTVDNLTLDGAVISSDTGAISFADENLTTTGTITGVNVTSGADPGHTHTIYLKADGSVELTGDMAVVPGVTIDGRDLRLDGQDLDLLVQIIGKMKVDSSATVDYLGAAFNDGILRTSTGITLTDGGDFVTLTTNDSEIDHGSLAGINDDDHTQYHTDARAETWLSAGHETTYNHANFATAFGWGDHGAAGYLRADGTVPLTADWTTGAHSIIGSDHWYLRADNKKMFFGAGDDASIYYSGVSLIIHPKEVGVGGVVISPGARLAVGLPLSFTENIGCQVYGENAEIDKKGAGVSSDYLFGPNGADNTSKSQDAIYCRYKTNANWTGNSTSWSSGFRGILAHYGSGTLADAHGMYFKIHIGAGGGDITKSYGVRVDFEDISSVGAHGNTYGVKISGANLASGTAFAFHSDGGIIYTVGAIGINTLPDEKLQVAGNIHVDDNYEMIFGTGKDAKIYYDNTDLTINPKVVGSGAVKIVGDTFWSGAGTGLPHGDIFGYEVGATITITGTGVANKVQVTSFAENGESNLMTPDHTNDHITVVKTGIYLVTASVSISSLGGTAYEMDFSCWKNDGGTEIRNVHAHRKMSGGGGDTASKSLSGTTALAAGDTLEIWCYNRTNTNDVVIESLTMSAVMVGG